MHNIIDKEEEYPIDKEENGYCFLLIGFRLFILSFPLLGWIVCAARHLEKGARKGRLHNCNFLFLLSSFFSSNLELRTSNFERPSPLASSL
jgi:hypothetical protein